MPPWRDEGIGGAPGRGETCAILPRVSVVLLRGAPGVGKSSAVDALRCYPGTAAIDVDDVWRCIGAARWAGDEFAVALDAAFAAAAAFIARGLRRVFIAAPFDDDALALAMARCPGCSVVGLVAHDDVIRSRLLARPPGLFCDVDLAIAINRRVSISSCVCVRTDDDDAVTVARAIHRV